MIGRPMILAHGAELKAAEAGNDGFYYPPNNVDWSEFSEVQFAVLVHELGGEPTAAELKCVFELLMPHTGLKGQEAFRYAKRAWTPVAEPAAIDGAGNKTVTTAGTPVKLSSSEVRCDWVTVTAMTKNTAIVAVGPEAVKAKAGEEKGNALYAGQSISLPARSLSDIWADSQVSGEGVSYSYGSETISSLIVGGKGFYGGAHVPPLVATQADELPMAPIHRTIKNFGQAARIGFSLSFTGGKEPFWKVSVTANGKG